MQKAKLDGRINKDLKKEIKSTPQPAVLNSNLRLQAHLLLLNHVPSHVEEKTKKINRKKYKVTVIVNGEFYN